LPFQIISEKIAKQIIREGIRVEFNAGLDIRLLDDEKASLLKKMRVSEPKFAWDSPKDEYMVMRGIEILRRNGINRSAFYVLVGFSTTFEEDLYRLNRLRDLDQRAFVMLFDNNKETLKDPRYSSLKKWANARMVFFKSNYEDFVKWYSETNGIGKEETIGDPK
jgi:hypothetical protein